MYLTAGIYNVILRQISLVGLSETEVLAVSGIEKSLLEKTKNRMMNCLNLRVAIYLFILKIFFMFRFLNSG